MGDSEGAELPIPEGVAMSPVPIRGVVGGWEIDARGATGGVLRLRGRDEDPVAIARSGSPVPIIPGDYGVIQYGMVSLFFQHTSQPKALAGGLRFEVLALLALLSSMVLHAGCLGFIRAVMTPPQIPKPLELTDADEYAARFGLRRTIIEEPEPEAGDDDSSGVPSPGADDDKEQGGGQKVRGDEGALGNNGPADRAQVPGEIRPTYGGLSDVLASESGEEIKETLQAIDTVSAALSGMNSQTLVLGGGPGTGLKGAGAGGGGTDKGVPFGSGTLDTGWGAGRGGGFGRGRGGPGGRGSGGHGAGGSGGSGSGGHGGGERTVAVSPGRPAARGGLTPEQIQRVVMAHKGALRACYESEVQRDPNLKGGVTIKWEISPAGSVSNVGVVRSSLGNARVEGCVTRRVKGWHFPKSDAPTRVTGYPFRFGVGG